MLVELAIGDAYGAGFEYADATFVPAHNTLASYVQHPRHGIRPGCYTDDTQISLALAEAIVEGEAWTPERLAERFVAAFHRDEREGYSQSFFYLLKSVSSGSGLLRRIRPVSDKSGAAMRAAPLGVFSTIDEVVRRSQVQAAITHNTPAGTGAATAAALMAHYCLYDRGPRQKLGRILEQHVRGGGWDEPWGGKVGPKRWMSVRAAITALAKCRSMSDLLRRSVAFTGDVDTVAAIALAAGSCCRGLEQDLPECLRTGLENGPFGRDHLARIDRAVLAQRA